MKKNFKNFVLLHKRDFLILIAPTIIVIYVLIHFAIQPHFFNDKHNYFSYIELSILSFTLSLLNSIPYMYRVIKKNTTFSYSLYALLISLISGSISVMNIIVSLNNGIKFNKYPMYIELLRWIPDVLSSFLGLTCVIIVVIKKIINMKQNKYEGIKILMYEHKKNTIILYWIVIIITWIVFGLSIWERVKNGKKNDEIPVWMFVIFSFSTYVAVLASTLQTIRIIISRHTYSISLVSKWSLVCASFIWTILDFETFMHENNSSSLVLVVIDIYYIIVESIVVYIKIKNMYESYKENLFEHEHFHKIIMKSRNYK